MLRLAPDITKQWIRERVSDEEIFSHYLKVDVVLRKKFCSPLRKDSNPTCNFFITRNGVLWMKDHSGHFAGNCYDLVMFMFGVDFREALEIIAKDFNLIEGNSNKTRVIRKQKKYVAEKVKIIVSPRGWSDRDLEFWGQYKIQKPLLQYFKVVPVQCVWLNDELHYTHNITDVAYAYIFGEDDIKIYFPMRDNARFLCNTNILQGYNHLPEKGENLIITKSYKDIMCLYNLGFPSVSPQSETQTITEEQYKDLSSRFKNIVSWYDFDLTGIRTANKMKRIYGIKPIFLTNGRFQSIDYKAKDISDLLRSVQYQREAYCIQQKIKRAIRLRS